jgi:hypothetical protein
MSSSEEIKARVMAHNGEFEVGDIISFSCLGDGVEQEGVLVQVIDCVYGLVETKWGRYQTALSTSKIIKKAESNDLE